MNVPIVIAPQGLSQSLEIASALSGLLPRNDKSLVDSDLIIDALFGTGLRAPLEGLEALAVQTINQAGQSGCRVLAVDIPSGIDSDTGEIRGIAVKASMTAVLGITKQGLLRGEGPRHAGEIRLVDIGLPA